MTLVIPTVDLRGQFAPIRDQGSRPTCLAFAASDAHGALLDPDTELSCEFLYYHAQKIGGRDATSGATVPDVLAALKSEGQPIEADWPYIQKKPDQVMKSWTPPTDFGDIYKRNGDRCGQLANDVVQYLNAGLPVISLIFLCDSFFAAQRGRIIETSPASTPNINMRHAVVAVGYGTASSGRCFLIRNSWGNGWGDDGYAWIAEDLFDASLYDIAVLKEGSHVSGNKAAA
ncbi:C1 family peptidase [uncultured Sulfitobacter sp.]|uniref:C1 family peptidase n=1 Tax=uncultured Sulfitobacter sp. TaxID=191468 RepID=UPI0026277CF0|nr:C1 family peptidase [uncultured Sulfitobacter sp.]